MSHTIAVHEVRCRSIVSRSRIPGVKLALNPYVGCQHDCLYCYARFMSQHTSHQLAWGRFVDVKVNAPAVLAKQIHRLRGKWITLSTVTDPYQPLEARTELTRRLLEQLVPSGAAVSLLTKSDLVLRDADLLARFGPARCEVGFSMACLDETARACFEPGAPPVERRLQALGELHRRGIRTWIFLAPLLPGISEHTVPELLAAARGSVDWLMVDTLHLRQGSWARISRALAAQYPALLRTWQQKRDEQRRLCGHIRAFCEASGIPVRIIGAVKSGRSQARHPQLWLPGVSRPARRP